MKNVTGLLSSHPKVSNYKINMHQKESYELFFVKGKLETLRRTDTCDQEVTVYVEHDGYVGDAQFFVYPSTTREQLIQKIDEAAAKASLIQNASFTLPEGTSGEYAVDSNFIDYTPEDLAAQIAEAVFAANTIENASLNSVEIFVNQHTETVLNSRGLHKTQTRYDAMVEAIPTYNGARQSVELYQQHNFAHFAKADIVSEVAEKLAQVKARYEAITPDFTIHCPVVLNIQEVAQLYSSISRNLNYSTVYSHANLFSKGDTIQKNPSGDIIGITMAGQTPGSVRSAAFDADGLSLGTQRIVDQGTAVSYYGSNRFGQYLNEVPTGSLPCLIADPGTASLPEGAYLEVVSMSGLQVDFFNDYIGGEVRLAYYFDGEKTVPVTGISISGNISQVLENIRLSADTGLYNGFYGPCKAVLTGMKVF